MARKTIEIGAVFGSLKVLDRAEDRLDSRGNRVYCVVAVCKCGNAFAVSERSLRSGNTKSCGCSRHEHLKTGNAHRRHGMSFTKTHRIWQGMIQRCTNEKAISFPNYGGRGISVCERWRKFDDFLADMGECPEGHSIDRIDNDRNYEPDNCRWADRRTQSENTSTVKLVELHGEVMSTTAALKRLGLSAGQAIDRMKRKGESRQQAIDYYAANGKSR